MSQVKHDHSCDALKISIIIPTLNEERSIESTLINLTRQHHPHEIIVVDGGSNDKTVEIASRYAKVVSSGRGRALQMNEGAYTATGDVFLFLHADTQLPNNALLKIEEALQSGKKQSGRFRMSFGHGHSLLKFYEYQTRFHLFSYGDQGFFVKRELFQEMGGFSVSAAFEDIDFYRRLLEHEKPVIIKDPVVTSPRRFLQNGIIRQKFINISLATMYYLGFQRSTIKQLQNAWYKDSREYAELKSV
jgi:rSAM/selenodomain-associated transferase 2